MKKFLVGFLIASLFFTGTSVWSQTAQDSSKSSEVQKQENSTSSSPATPLTSSRVPFEALSDIKNYEVESVADSLEYDKTRNLLIAKGNVVLTHENVKLTSDYAELDTQSSKALARGHVIVFKNDVPTIKGSEVYYDFKTHHGNFPDGRFVSLPWRGTGVEVEQKKDGLHTIKNCSITTCGSENPNYEFRAKQATVYAGEKIVVRDVWLYVMNKKVFWVPYMVIPLNLPNIPFSVVAGNNKRFGFYVGIMKGYYINQHLYGRLYFDWRSRKGFGGGLTQQYNYGKWAKGDVKLYWTQDKEAPTPGFTDLSGQESPYALKEKRDRGRITWRHRTDFDPGTFLVLRYHRVADEYFLQDFFPRENRSEIQPSSFVTLTHNTERYGVYAHGEKRMNSYEKTVEHLPEVRADWKDQQLTNGLYNQSQASVNNLKMRFGRSDYEENTFRSDANTHFYYPVKWDNGIKLNPFVGSSLTHYTRDQHTDNSRLRAAASTGFDLRTQYYKLMKAENHKMGIEINQLRHVLEPNFQAETSGSSLNPQKISRYDSIDDANSTSRLQFGLDNRLQTKRVVNGTMQRVDIVSLNTYVRYDVHPTDRHGSALTILANDLTLRPYNWLLYESKLEHDLDYGQLQRFSQDLIFVKDRWRLLFGHRYASIEMLKRQNLLYDTFNTDQHAIDGNQFVFEGHYTINPLWTVGGYTRWNATHQVFEEWQISASRNLGCDLVMDFGFDMRNSLVEKSNRELFVNIRMQSIPQMHLNIGANEATISQPRIGQTVDGSSEQEGQFSSSYASRYSPNAYLY